MCHSKYICRYGCGIQLSETAAEQKMTVQVGVSTFASTETLDVLDQPLGEFTACCDGTR